MKTIELNGWKVEATIGHNGNLILKATHEDGSSINEANAVLESQSTEWVADIITEKQEM